jgi:hypothetical protein
MHQHSARRSRARGRVPRLGTATSRGTGGLCHSPDAWLSPAPPCSALGGCGQSSPLLELRSDAVPYLAARAGRWSAQYRKTAILGWILFVVLASDQVAKQIGVGLAAAILPKFEHEPEAAPAPA